MQQQSDRGALMEQAGFTLLEVLVAFTICSFMLGAFFQIFSNGLQQDRTTDRYATALLHAESLLAQTGKTEPLRVGQEEGRTDDGFSWRIVQTLYEEKENRFEQTPLVPYRIKLTINWADGTTGRSLSLSTLRLARRY